MNTVACRDCGGLVSKRAKRCPHCGAPARKQTTLGTGCLTIVIGTAGGLYLLLQLPNSTVKSLTAPPAPRPTESATQPSTQPQVLRGWEINNGQIAVLRGGGTSGGRSGTFLATSEDAHDRMVQLFSADDSVGFAEMRLNRRVFFVPDGTKCRMIGSHVGVSEVRIVDGDEAGRSGFVTSEFIWSK